MTARRLSSGPRPPVHGEPHGALAEVRGSERVARLLLTVCAGACGGNGTPNGILSCTRQLQTKFLADIKPESTAPVQNRVEPSVREEARAGGVSLRTAPDRYRLRRREGLLFAVCRRKLREVLRSAPVQLEPIRSGKQELLLLTG